MTREPPSVGSTVTVTVDAEKIGRQRMYRVLPQGLRNLQAEIDKFWTDELDLLVADAHELNQRRNRPAGLGEDR